MDKKKEFKRLLKCAEGYPSKRRKGHQYPVQQQQLFNRITHLSYEADKIMSRKDFRKIMKKIFGNVKQIKSEWKKYQQYINSGQDFLDI